MHGHDGGHELAHDEEDWESCTYGDIGVAGLAVLKEDLVNLGKEKSMKSFDNFSQNQLFHLLTALVHMLLVVKIPHLA